MAVVLMSKAELSRVDTLARVDRGELPVAGAASLLGLSPRQVFRLLARFRAEGASGLASRRRGRPSNRRLPAAVREAALAVVREGSVSARASKYRCAELKPPVAQAAFKMPSTATVLRRSQPSSARAVARDLTEPLSFARTGTFRPCACIQLSRASMAMSCTFTFA